MKQRGKVYFLNCLNIYFYGFSKFLLIFINNYSIHYITYNQNNKYRIGLNISFIKQN